MSSTPIPISDAIKMVKGSATHIIVCDTCAFLDIIRLPQPGRIENVTGLNATLDAIDAVMGLVDKGQVTLVCPRLVYTEWHKHALNIKTETLRTLEQIELDYLKNAELAKRAGHTFPKVTFHTGAIAQHLYDLSERLLDACILLDSSVGATQRASDRAISYTAPASKGAIQDCVIYEHLIEFFDELTLAAPLGKRFLLTSNTKDYCTDKGLPKPPIDIELAYRNVVFCTRWPWAAGLILQQ